VKEEPFVWNGRLAPPAPVKRRGFDGTTSGATSAAVVQFATGGEARGRSSRDLGTAALPRGPTRPEEEQGDQ